MTERLAPQFGVSVYPSAANIEQAFQVAEMADQAGIEYLGAQDHPSNAEFLDTWTLLAMIAARTQHIRIQPNVLNIPLRPAPMLAKSAVTVDLISGGRVELGIGSGASMEASASFGGPLLSRGEAVEELREAIELMRSFWRNAATGSVLNFAGKYYQMHRAQPGPAAAHEIGIWVGSYGPRMLQLTGRLGDGWLPTSAYLPIEYVPTAQAAIDEGASIVGRPTTAIRRGYNVMGMITPRGTTTRSSRPGFIVGTAQQWIDAFTRFYTEKRLDTLIFWASGDEVEQNRRFIEEVVPALRERLK